MTPDLQSGLIAAIGAVQLRAGNFNGSCLERSVTLGFQPNRQERNRTSLMTTQPTEKETKKKVGITVFRFAPTYFHYGYFL